MSSIDPAAVNDVRLAGGESRCIARKVQRQRRDLLGPTETTHRLTRNELAVHLGNRSSRRFGLPGGGFQGGVIIATSFLLIYLGDSYASWRKLIRSPAADLCESGGALLFLFMAAAPLFWGLAFASNILPLGTFKSAWSGGTMFVDNIGVTFAVAGSFTLVFLEFMEETRREEAGDEDPGAER